MTFFYTKGPLTYLLCFEIPVRKLDSGVSINILLQ